MTLGLLRDIRSLRALVIHPQDREAEELIEQLRRIGCKTQAIWPPPVVPPEGFDVIFLAISQDVLQVAGERYARHILIGIIEYENPATLDAMIRLGIRAVVTKPVRAFGLLTNLLLARTIESEQTEARKRLAKVEGRLNGLKRVEKAKALLMERNGVSEEQAYGLIRDQAMAKRVSMDSVATAILSASDVFAAPVRK